MKSLFLSLVMFISSGAYASPIMSDSSIVTLKVRNDTTVHVTRCEEFNALIDRGEKISDYPDMPDRFISEIKEALPQCRINRIAQNENLLEINDTTENKTIQEVIAA